MPTLHSRRSYGHAPSEGVVRAALAPCGRVAFVASLATQLTLAALGCSPAPSEPAAASALPSTAHTASTAPAASAAAATPALSPCDRAAHGRARVPALLADGRLHRTLRVIEKANERCPATRAATLAAEVATLAELGRYEDARMLAAEAPVDARSAVEAAVKVADERDYDAQRFPDTDKAKAKMHQTEDAAARLAEQAIAAKERGDVIAETALHVQARTKYLEAWKLWRPNGPALYGAALESDALGERGEAQRLRDRALAELEQFNGKSAEVGTWLMGDVEDVAHSPDGRTIAVASGSDIVLIDASTFRLKCRLVGTDIVFSVSWSPDGRTLASASQNKTVSLWDAKTGRETRKLHGHTEAVTSVAWSPDGQTVASASIDRTVRVWGAKTGAEKRKLVGHTGIISAVAWSPDGRALVSGGEYGSLRLWHVRSGQETMSLSAPVKGVLSVAWSPDGKTVASAARTSVQLWDVKTGKKMRELHGHTHWVTSVSWSPDGRRLASASWDSTARVWDAVTGAELRSMAGRQAVSWSPDGKTLVSGAWAQALLRWDVSSGAETMRLDREVCVATTLSWSSKGMLASACSDGTVRVLNAKSGTATLLLVGPTGGADPVAWSPDARTLASWGTDKTVWLWDTGTGKTKQKIDVRSSLATAVSWSPDGRKLAYGADDGSLRLWDATTSTETRKLDAPGATSVSWSADGRVLASGHERSPVRLWDAKTGQQISRLTERTEFVAWSSDGRTLALGTREGALSLWDATTRRSRWLQQGDLSVRGTLLAWSPDGRTLASGTDSTVRLWDALTGKETRTLEGHGEWVTSLAWSRGGLASASKDGTIRLWNAETGSEVWRSGALAGVDATYTVTPQSHTVISGGQPEKARDALLCVLGARTFPFDLCRERFEVTSLDGDYREP